MGDDDESQHVTPLRIVGGRTPPTKQQIEEYLVELVKTKKISEILYQAKRNEISADTGIKRGALDEDVDKRIKAEEAKDNTSDLYKIGKRLTKELWHDGSKVPYATLARSGHLEHVKIDSEDYRDWLQEKYGELNKDQNEDGEIEERAPKSAEVDEAIRQLSSRARNKRWHKEYDPRVRLNYDRGALWLDLGAKCVRIDADG